MWFTHHGTSRQAVALGGPGLEVQHPRQRLAIGTPAAAVRQEVRRLRCAAAAVGARKVVPAPDQAGVGRARVVFRELRVDVGCAFRGLVL